MVAIALVQRPSGSSPQGTTPRSNRASDWHPATPSPVGPVALSATRFGALLLTVLAALCYAPAGTAELRAFADPQSLDETETLRLTLRLEGRSRAEPPNLGPLEKDFDVLGSSNSSQYRSVNGQVRAWVEYQISLRPKRAGQLEIPSLTMGNESSPSLTVDVRPLDPALKRSIDEMVFFETELSPGPIYVQGELRITRRLLYSTSGGVQMYTDLPGAPDIANAVVVTLGDAASYAVERNGIEYGVVEQRFAVFPEASGALTVPAAALTTSVRVLKNGRMRRSGVRVRSEELTVTVLPIPAQYPADAPWLPATSVSLTQEILPRDTVNTGATARLKLVAAVTGNVASSIAPIPHPVPADRFREYPQAASTSDEVVGSDLVGTREQLLSLVALKPGMVVLESPVLTWWNTNTGTVEQTRADALPLTVTGTAVVDGADPDATADADATAPPTGEPQTKGTASALPGQLAKAFVLLVALGLAAFGLPYGFRALAGRKARGPVGAKGRRQQARQRLKALLDQAATANAGNPQASAAVRRGLLQALGFALGIEEVDVVRRLAGDSKTQKLLAALDALAYQPAPQRTARPMEIPTLAAVLEAFDHHAPPVTRGSRAAALPALYPVTQDSARPWS